MANYPIKMLKDETNTPFVPLVGANAIIYNGDETLEQILNKKLEKTNIIAGDNITLSVSGNNITINGHAGSSISLINNLTTSTAGQGALDAYQGYILKGMIDNLPRVIDDITSTSQTNALSANQGRILNINKQDKLVSGTNIKTINNESLLGSGNIIVSASPEISISTATPSDDEVLWIDPTEDYINTTTEVIDSLDGNEHSLAPSVAAVKDAYTCIAILGSPVDTVPGVGIQITGFNKLRDSHNMLINDRIRVPKTGYYYIGYTMRLTDISGTPHDVYTCLKPNNDSLYRSCCL